MKQRSTFQILPYTMEVIGGVKRTYKFSRYPRLTETTLCNVPAKMYYVYDQMYKKVNTILSNFGNIFKHLYINRMLFTTSTE